MGFLREGWRQLWPSGLPAFTVGSGNQAQGLNTTVLNFQITTASGTIFNVPHNLPVTPQIIFASISGRTEIVETAGRLRTKKGFGVAIKPGPLQSISQFCFGTNSDDATVLTGSSDTIRKDAIVATMSSGLAAQAFPQGILSLIAVDSGVVTFQVLQGFDFNYTVNLQLIGGTDITRLDLAGYTSAAGTGLESRTDPGFKPDFIMFMGGHTNTSTNAIENDSSTFIGVADKNLNQFVLGDGVNDAGGTGSGRCMSYCKSGECVTHWNSSVNGFDTHGSLNSMDPLGFTINWTKAVNRVYFALCIQGGNWSVGNFLTQLDLSENQVVSNLSFQPDGEMLFSAGKPASITDQIDANDQWSIGFVKGSVLNENQYVFGRNSVAPTIQGAAYSPSKSYIETNMSGTIISELAVTSTQSNGFSIQHTLTSSGQNFVGYVAFSHVTVPSFTTIIKTVKPGGGGDYLSLASGIKGELTLHQNLISQNIVLQFDCYPGIDIKNDNAVLIIPGWNNTGNVGYKTDAQHYLTINCINGHQGLFDATGSSYLFDFYTPDGTQNGILVRAEFVRFKQFQLRMNVTSGTATNNGYIIGSTQMVAPTDHYYINCIAKGNLISGAMCHGFMAPGSAFDDVGVKATYINCIAYDFLSQDITLNGFNTANCFNQDIKHLNCTAYNCNQGFQDHIDVTQINCLALNCDNGWNTSTGPGSRSQNNFSTCGPATIINSGYWPGTAQTGTPDAKGLHSFNGQGILLVDPINGDIRPQASEQVLNNGIDASVYSSFPYSYDVAGTPRIGTWTIGAFQNNQSIVQGVKWAIAGNVTNTTVTLSAKLNISESNVYVDLSQNSDLSSSTRYGPVSVNANLVARFDITTTSNTQYYYQIVINNIRIGAIYDFKSFPTPNSPASFVFSCGGCSDTGSNSNIYNTIRSKNPLVHINYGDLHYYNINANDITVFRQAFDTAMLAPKQQALYKTTALDYMWDDHDFGADNSSGGSAAEPAAQAFYRENWPNYPLPASNGSIYHSFVLGRCRFILTDLRSERDNNNNSDGPSHTMLDSTQLTWFKNELSLARSNNQVAFWFSTVPWIASGHNDGNAADSWGGFTNQRTVISDYIKTLNYSNIIIFCGDMHSAVIDDGTHDVFNSDGTGNNLTMFLPFPLNQTTQTYSGTWTKGPIIHGGTRLMGFAGIVTVTDNINTISVKLDVINELQTLITTTKVFNISSGSIDQLVGNIPIVSWLDNMQQIAGNLFIKGSLSGGT